MKNPAMKVKPVRKSRIFLGMALVLLLALSGLAIAAPASAQASTFTITATAGEGGSIEPSGEVSVLEGTDITFTLTPDPGYMVAEVFVDYRGTELDEGSTYTFRNVTSSHTIEATFYCPPTIYTIKASAGPGGSIDPHGEIMVEEGASQAFSVTPDSLYQVDKVLVDGAEVALDGRGNYTFADVTSSHTIHATFAPTTANPTIVANADPPEGGEVTGGGEYEVGEMVTVSATARPGYHFVRWSENGREVVRTPDYSFSMELSRVLVASFEPVAPPSTTWIDSWSPAGAREITCLVGDATSGLLYAGTDGAGVWAFDGSSWTCIGMEGEAVTSLACDPGNGRLFAAANDIVKAWSGSGWTDTGMVGLTAYSLCYDSTHALLYAGTEAGVLCWDGTSWAQRGMNGITVRALACDEVNNLLYAAADVYGLWVWNGSDWTRIWMSAAFYRALCYQPGNGIVYVGGSFVGTWDRHNMNQIGSVGGIVSALACDSAQGILYAGTEDGVWSFDGTSWRETGGGVSGCTVSSLARDARDGRLYAGTTTRGVWYAAVAQPTLTALSLTATECDYSDPTTLAASLTCGGEPVGGAEIAFDLGDAAVGIAVTGEDGTATLTAAVSLPAGVYPGGASASFVGDEAAGPSGSEASCDLVVTAEDAALVYEGEYVKAYGSTIKLSASVDQEEDGNLGEIAKAGNVVFGIYDSNNVLVRQETAPVSTAGVAEVVTTALPANVYTVKTSLVGSGYYQAAPATDAQLVIYNPDGGFATGGGFLCDGGFKTFGFCVKPSHADPWLPKGNLLLVDLSDLRKPRTVKATGFAWLVIPADEDVAYIAGTCSLDGEGGYSFFLTVEDLGGWLARLDTIDLVVKDSAGNVAYAARGAIDGGNIQLHRK